jgi:hypothetical protein
MSQRECAGFNWPGLPVAAGEPVGAGPEASAAIAFVQRSFCQPLRAASLSAPSGVRTDLSPSFAPGVAHPASHTTRPSRLFIGTPASADAPSFQSRVVGVGHEARVATAFKLTVALLPSGLRPVALAPFAICEPVAFPTVGVGHEARVATVFRLLSVFPAAL